MRWFVSAAAVIFFGNTLVRAAPPADLQTVLKDGDIAAHWIYDDLAKGKAAAKESGKPLLIVVRCVPCPPGKTLDKAVNQPDAAMKALEDKFICVRIIQTNGLDLRVFQYDYDNSWVAMFMNADGTIYGRYGTRNASGPGSDTFHNSPSFQRTMERALEVHKNYPAEKAALAAKLGKPPEYPVPEKIPGLTDKGAKATTRQTCIHCHMVKDYALRDKWLNKKLTKEDLLVYPMPERIGLKLDEQDGLKVKSVAAAEPAGKAGIKTGDELVRLNGQPLLSMADVQWVLHNAPVETTVKAVVRRGGEMIDADIVLSGTWKESDIAWRASSWYGLRNGLRTVALTAAEKEKRGLKPDAAALNVSGIFGRSADVLKKAGLKTGDVIVEMDGKPVPATESQFLLDLRLGHGPGESVKFTVLRADKRVDLTVPMW